MSSKHHKKHGGHSSPGISFKKKRHNSDSSSDDGEQRKKAHKSRNERTGDDGERPSRNERTGDDGERPSRNERTGDDGERPSRNERTGGNGERHSRNERTGDDGEKHSRHRRRHRDSEYDPHLRIKEERDEENFEDQQRDRSRNNAQRRDQRREREQNGGDFGLNTVQVKGEGEEGQPAEKQKPNFQLSGKLTEDTNTFRGVVIKYNEPHEAMKPKRRWRLYPFKGETALPVLHIHRQSAYLLGRDRKIADIPVDHPSCSKQQAVLQFRAMPYTRPDGTPGRRVRPYIIDLDSANGTFLNNEKIDARRYYELREKDVLKFGFSTREYVVLHDSVDLSEVTEGDDMEEV
ncbi:smad nuclear-interacting protein 1-like [Physella acuta]|uniref:smad nuclear-interacting protein 1-like n=1 Tax=Physella acuta TaxID=109671 RepID=UPI0027DD9DD0|nr:smad nuclear-interacting protein 1-like [Physella acuta]